jgi:hypothetical protein
LVASKLTRHENPERRTEVIEDPGSLLGEDDDDDVEETDEGPRGEPGEEVGVESSGTEEATEDDSSDETCDEGDSEVLREHGEWRKWLGWDE